MGALAALAPLLGILAGIIVTQLAKSELKDGKKYFIILQHALLAIIFATLIWKWQMTATIAGVLIFGFLWKTKFQHYIELMPILAVPAILAPNTQIPIFLYFIPTGTLHWKESKKLSIMATIYATIAIISSLPF